MKWNKGKARIRDKKWEKGKKMMEIKGDRRREKERWWRGRVVDGACENTICTREREAKGKYNFPAGIFTKCESVNTAY